MNHESQHAPPPEDGRRASGYRPPMVTSLGNLADLTQAKEVGGADGTVFQGIDLGSA